MKSSWRVVIACGSLFAACILWGVVWFSANWIHKSDFSGKCRRYWGILRLRGHCWCTDMEPNNSSFNNPQLVIPSFVLARLTFLLSMGIFLSLNGNRALNLQVLTEALQCLIFFSPGLWWLISCRGFDQHWAHHFTTCEEREIAYHHWPNLALWLSSRWVGPAQWDSWLYWNLIR